MVNQSDNADSWLQTFVRTYKKSELIFQQGSSGNEMYLIRNGRVKISVKQAPNDEEHTLAVLPPGSFFGEMALLDDYPRSANAEALDEPTEVIALDRAKFLFVIRQQPEFALSIMHVLCQRIRSLNQQKPPGDL
jgi:CRP/FNR family transcriptional regulator, cyclic AMP receptor protein